MGLTRWRDCDEQWRICVAPLEGGPQTESIQSRMQEPHTDSESLRHANTERLADCFAGITHFGWHTATATVLSCKPVRRRYAFSRAQYLPPFRGQELPALVGYIVEFSYIVNGTKYTGVLDSLYEVECGDEFHIRYNPAVPRENNSLGSSGDTDSRIASFTTPLLVTLLLVALVLHFMHRL